MSTEYEEYLKHIPVDFFKKQPIIKLIVSGSMFEQFEFEIPPRVTKRKKDNRQKMTKEERIKAYLAGDDWRKNYQKTKKEIERLINCNSQLDKFLTLTFKKNISDINIANNHFHNFVSRTRRVHPGFQYICVPERQKRGAIHYHLLCLLPYVPNKRLARLWGHGFINIKRTDKIKDLARYITKYLTKELFDGSLFGKRKFFCSAELNRPLIYRDDDALDVLCDTSNLDELYSKEFPLPYLGKMKYTLLKVNNKSDISSLIKQ